MRVSLIFLKEKVALPLATDTLKIKRSEIDTAKQTVTLTFVDQSSLTAQGPIALAIAQCLEVAP